MTRVGIWMFLFSLMIMSTMTPMGYADERKIESAYNSPEGISFTSYSKKWDEAKLEGLYQMLLNCGHGEELQSLKKVVLDPERSTGKSGARVGGYNENESAIRIYEADVIPVERILVHEYGHHFTYYWLKKKEGKSPNELTEASEWSKLRQLDGYPIRWSGSPMTYQHKWDPAEIMAEDYVLLFGIASQKPPTRPEEVVNYARHENEYIPSVYTLPAVREYWEKAAGLLAKPLLTEPEIQGMELEQASGDEPARLKVKLESVKEDWLSGKVLYAAKLVLFPTAGGWPEREIATMESDSAEDLEITIPISAAEHSNDKYYGHVSIWAYHEDTRQMTNTPLYDNWVELSNINESNSSTSIKKVLRDIPPPWDQQGLTNILRNEGLKRWPIMYMMIDGRLQAMGTRGVSMNQDGTINIPLKVLARTKLAKKATVAFRWGGHSFIVRTGQEEAVVDGKRVPLKLNNVGGEPMISANELGRLVGAQMTWKETESTLVFEKRLESRIESIGE
ncbi:hypothetical protein [Paenibacillus cremeus]|uniref:Uncharacterized protein n=1 Tax=Paenibacillus cremeus TaxID=2163881 RepID=A0A559K3R7_9BACL|nr:hypothetical protein [Paenibacillus cremeus]TVY06720.1 hypothetical protein FPZ49_27565 [Paenibacillus cremeus]